ncbi:MAG: ABC transporter permease subunit [Chloroflexota bacterium]|nr:ABC transporter permease subunit [Chloroflexota bacterium]
MTKNRKLSPVWYGVGLFSFIVLWEITALSLHSPYFTPFTQVVAALFNLVIGGQAWLHIEASLEHLILGFALAAILGFLVGLLLSQSRIIRAILMPVIDAMRSVAALTMFPLLILVLGLGLASKAFVIFWTAWPAILLSTTHSITHVDRIMLDAAVLDGAGRSRLLSAIVLPLASPGILNGLRIGLSGGWISLVAAEMLGSSKGLGYFVLISSQVFRYADMYAAIVLISLLGFLMNITLAILQTVVEAKLCLKD